MARNRVAWRAPAWIAGSACVLGLAGAGYVYGCSVYDPSLLLPAKAMDSGADVSMNDGPGPPDSGAPEAGPGPCADIVPPAPPAMDDPSDASDQTFIVALHTVNLGLGDAGIAGLGYDLDKVYTHTTAPACGPESCKAPVVGTTHPDGPGGVDDSAGQLIQTVGSFMNLTNEGVNQQLAMGLYSLLFQVLHYNGTANDTQVSVGVYGSLGIEGDAGPMWNGRDSWTIDSNFVANGDAQPFLPNHLDGQGYVSGGVLVVRIDFPITIRVGGVVLTIELTAGVATTTLQPVGDGTYRARSGQIAGRWRVADLLASIQALQHGTFSLCQGGATYDLVKQLACKYADIMTDPTEDLMGSTCDALSLGGGFTADPALMGSVVTPAPQPAPCEAGTPDMCGP